ncbi:MAG: hypothetical protein LBG31_07045 [Prevotellaceae bacterium]|nr:hypothetical protein [Prevotellaceae bacterium]
MTELQEGVVSLRVATAYCYIGYRRIFSVGGDRKRNDFYRLPLPFAWNCDGNCMVVRCRFEYLPVHFSIFRKYYEKLNKKIACVRGRLMIDDF